MKRRIAAAAAVLIVLFSALALTSCADRKYSDGFFMMDTYMNMTYYGKGAENAAEKVRKALAEIEKEYGISGNGCVASLNSGEKITDAPDGLISMLELADELYLLTDGAYDVTVLPLVSLWGFDGGEKRVPTDGEIAEAQKNVGNDRMTVSGKSVSAGEGTRIDLGSLAKGYAAETALEVLKKENGITGGVLSLGGNVQTFGEKPDGSDFLIGIADPFEPENVIGTLKINGEKAIVTSGTYQRYFEENGIRYHHILDAKTGRPSESDLVSVTVVCRSALRADGFSTALFLLGSEKASGYLKTAEDLGAVLVTRDGTVLVTENLSACFTLADGIYKTKIIGK